ncbi:MAG: TIGR00730 family Rossman fold protein [Anaerolineae bacterium]
MAMNICVYCSSSDHIDGVYFAAAATLGTEMARRDDTLVYGGAGIGLMGALARAVKAGGGRVIGVVPELLRPEPITFHEADELIFTQDMRERKATMERHADAFVVLPGGFGTLEELTEVLTLRQLRAHTKPLVLLNVDGFWQPLIALFEHFYRGGFARRWDDLYYVADNVSEALGFLDAYRATPPPTKWEEWESQDD